MHHNRFMLMKELDKPVGKGKNDEILFVVKVVVTSQWRIITAFLTKRKIKRYMCIIYSSHLAQICILLR